MIVLKIYSVINMDIVNSRKLNNRKEINIQLENYFKSLEEQYKDSLVSKITFTLGDEWQIVLRDIKVSYDISTKIKVFLYNFDIECYCGIGIGTISTKEDDDTRKMDGEAFIYARQALEIAKSNKKFYSKKLYTKDCKTVLKGAVPKSNIMEEAAVTCDDDSHVLINYAELINNIIQNNEMIESKFTYKQRNIIALYEKLESYSEIQHKYPNISKSGISRKITSSNYLLTLHNKKMINKLLSSYEKELSLREI